MEIDADAILRQCLDWERSLVPPSRAKVIGHGAGDEPRLKAPMLHETGDGLECQRVAELSALAGLLQPGQAMGLTAAKKPKRGMPAESALLLDQTRASNETKPYNVNASAPVLTTARERSAAASSASAAPSAAATGVGDARSVVVGRIGARPTQSERREAAKATAGRNWFDMPRIEADTKTAADLQALRSRQWLNPKRFYKTKGEDRSLASRLEYFHAGTVVAGKLDHRTSTMTRRQRPSSLLEELTSDDRVDSFTRRTQRAVQEAASRAGGAGARRRAKRALSRGKATTPKHTRTSYGNG